MLLIYLEYPSSFGPPGKQIFIILQGSPSYLLFSSFPKHPTPSLEGRIVPIHLFITGLTRVLRRHLLPHCPSMTPSKAEAVFSSLQHQGLIQCSDHSWMLNKSVLNEQINRPFPVCSIRMQLHYRSNMWEHMLYINIQQLLVIYMEFVFPLK